MRPKIWMRSGIWCWRRIVICIGAVAMPCQAWGNHVYLSSSPLSERERNISGSILYLPSIHAAEKLIREVIKSHLIKSICVPNHWPAWQWQWAWPIYVYVFCCCTAALVRHSYCYSSLLCGCVQRELTFDICAYVYTLYPWRREG